MPVAPAEDEPPKQEPTFEELAEFVSWGREFVEHLANAPTAQEET